MPKCPYYPGVRIKCVNMDTKGTCRSVRIIRGSVLSVLIWTPRGHGEVSVLSGIIKRVIIRVFNSSGHTKLSVISGCPY